MLLAAGSLLSYLVQSTATSTSYSIWHSGHQYRYICCSRTTRPNCALGNQKINLDSARWGSRGSILHYTSSYTTLPSLVHYPCSHRGSELPMEEQKNSAALKLTAKNLKRSKSQYCPDIHALFYACPRCHSPLGRIAIPPCIRVSNHWLCSVL